MSAHSLSQPPAAAVTLEQHTEAWKDIFRSERDKLKGLFGPDVQQIDHIGSTAVKELVAKPIVDILAGMRSLDDPGYYAAILLALGYVHVPEGGDEDRLYFRHENPDIHLHLVQQHTWTWRKHVLFRDMLRADDDLRLRYGALKEKLVADHDGEREAYNREKAAFIEEFLKSFQEK